MTDEEKAIINSESKYDTPIINIKNLGNDQLISINDLSHIYILQNTFDPYTLVSANNKIIALQDLIFQWVNTVPKIKMQDFLINYFFNE